MNGGKIFSSRVDSDREYARSYRLCPTASKFIFKGNILLRIPRMKLDRPINHYYYYIGIHTGEASSALIFENLNKAMQGARKSLIYVYRSTNELLLSSCNV